MHNVLTVAVCDACRDAAHDVASLRLWQQLAGVDVVQEIPVLGHLEHEVDLQRSLHHAKHSEDALVVEALDGGHLSREKLGEHFE